MNRKRIATIWLCGCSGCHMSLLDLDERLFELASAADLVSSPICDVKDLPECDIVLVEGSVANEENLHVLQTARARARLLVSLGDCAGFGCVPMLRNQFDVGAVLEHSYINVPSTALGAVPESEVPRLLPKVRPIHELVQVDAWIPGCPPSADAIWTAVRALLTGEPGKAAKSLRYD